MTTTRERLASALSDRYRLERELGAGGMATVYLAHDLKHDRKVAIKVLRPELAAVIGADRFLSEIRTTANLQHPHILPLFDSGESDGFLFYVMPYVEGETLRDRIVRESQLPIADAVRIAREVADALDYAHKRGVVHRDIKPENILLHDGRALVADFGIALAASKAGESRMTQTGMSLGTPSYMSPEQAMGDRNIGPRSDIYALGAMTYEMLVGDPPFAGSTAQAIVAKVMTEKPVPPTRMRDTIPPAVEHAVLTALQKLPADRFDSAHAFAEALENKAFTGPDTSTTVLHARPGAAGGSRRTLTALAGLCAVLLAAALWGWLRPTPAATSRQRVLLWHHPMGQFLAPGVERLATQATIAPDGSSIVFSDSVGGVIQLMRKLRDGRDPVPVAGTEGGVSPFFSPDGAWIGFITVDGKLRKVPAAGGGAITLAVATNPVYAAAVWLEDGTILYVDDSTAVRRVPAEGGAGTVVIASGATQRLSAPALSPLPGSRGFLYTACPGNCGLESAVYVFDFAADSGRRLIDHAAGAWYSPTGHLLYTDRAGGLYAAGFDLGRLALTSGAVPVIDEVAPASFSLSASGSALYSVGAAGRTPSIMVWVSRDGSVEPLDSTWRGDFEYPALSPDGKALAVSLREESTQLWIWRTDGTRQKLTQDGTVNWRPSWTPDGQSVAFISNKAGSNSQDDYFIYRMRVDGSAPSELLLRHGFGLWEAELSRDGRWLVLRSDEAGNNANLYARRLDGDTALVPLLVDINLSMQVALSPDGRWLAYASDATGRRDIYVASFPDMKSIRLVSRDGGTEPRWAHSGRELFYKSGSHLMAVDVTRGPTFTAGVPRRLFPLQGFRSARNRQQYDVSPDDRRFVMIQSLPDTSRSGVVYVENWLEELKAKVKQ